MKRRRLTKQEREVIWRRYQGAVQNGKEFVVQQIAREYDVSRPTIYAVLAKGELNELAGRRWLTEPEREEIRRRFSHARQHQGSFVITSIAREYEVSRPTIYAVLAGESKDHGNISTGDLTQLSLSDQALWLQEGPHGSVRLPRIIFSQGGEHDTNG